MKRTSMTIALAATISVMSCAPASGGSAAPKRVTASYSPLWGEAGELWDPSGPLSDFSHVGYHQGDDPVPYNQAPITFGPGRYAITSVIRLGSGQVLRGAGRDQTTLVFERPLAELGYRTDTYSYWDWWGGVVWAENANEVGVEDLTIEFPEHAFAHWAGTGYNGINFENSRDCWVKNVRIVNYDVGVGFQLTSQCTAEDVDLIKNAGGDGSHIDVHMSGGSQNLVNRVQITSEGNPRSMV